jgi:hypothetical protein
MHKYLIMILTLLLAGCGGGGGGDISTAVAPVVAPLVNTAPVTVDGTFGVVNRAYTSVTLCSPGTSTCQTIDHVLIDTGSVGLRLLATPAITALGLTSQSTTAGNQLGECYFFAASYVWGSVKLADVKMGGETAPNTAIQIVADPALPVAPLSCSNTGGLAQDSAAAMNANGILGIGATPFDCGAGCADVLANNRYFTCTGTIGCLNTTTALALQTEDPVANFTQDNNGVILQLPAIADTGAASAAGQLVFGIGTQSDNGLGAAQVYTTNDNGDFTTTYKGTAYPDSFIDSGTNRFIFQDSTLPTCTGTVDYCPAASTSLSAINSGLNGQSGTVDFNVVDVNSLFANGNYAQNDRAGPISGLSSSPSFATSFDWGLSFFYGRSVYVAFNGRSTVGGVGPYYAY